jgi:hypothetical protein
LESPFLHRKYGYVRAIPFPFIVTIEIAKASRMLNVGDNLPVVGEDYQVNVVAIIDVYTSSPWPDKSEVVVDCLKPYSPPNGHRAGMPSSISGLRGSDT